MCFSAYIHCEKKTGKLGHSDIGEERKTNISVPKVKKKKKQQQVY